MRYEEWEAGVPAEVRSDPLWTLRVYRAALFAGEIGGADADQLAARPERGALADQLRRSTESISANIAEGYSRLSLRDRARYYEYAIGSAREARDWYYKTRDSLDAVHVAERISSLTSIIRIMTTLVSRQRPIREPHP